MKWLRLSILALGLMVSATQARAEKLLADLNLEDGATWEIVGVSLHNYRLVPLQKELGTFVIKSTEVLKAMQQAWDFPLMFNDYCEWHYSLKIYRNRELVKTLRVNLVCNYVTVGSFSYRFDPALMAVFRNEQVKLPWSRIRFTDVKNMRTALRKLSERNDVYFYNDIKPYQYDGYFLLGIENIPIRTNRDSLNQVISERLKVVTGSDNFYLQSYIMTLDEKSRTLNLRFKIYCDQPFADQFYRVEKSRADGTMLVAWRNHMTYENFLQAIVVGVNEDRYWQIIGLPKPKPISDPQ